MDSLYLTSSGTIFVETEVTNDENSDDLSQLVVRVEDSGTGIDTEILPYLFSNFVTKSDRGTGLGLYIARSIIEAHGGKRWGKNNEDVRGATFSFSLPLQKQIESVKESKLQNNGEVEAQ